MATNSKHELELTCKGLVAAVTKTLVLRLVRAPLSVIVLVGRAAESFAMSFKDDIFCILFVFMVMGSLAESS